MNSPNPPLPVQVDSAHVKRLNLPHSYYRPKLVSFAPRSKTPIETFERLSKAYGESFIAICKVYEGNKGYKEGTESIEEAEHVGRLISSFVKNVAWVYECIQKDRRQTLAQITEDTHISKTSLERIRSS
ncbi:hypothetical protein TNCV_5088891 [Trichonephila clavipes]|nr:hypothetical protein TNCV_5088891 [Trichonephila clavipes]